MAVAVLELRAPASRERDRTQLRDSLELYEALRNRYSNLFIIGDLNSSYATTEMLREVYETTERVTLCLG